MDAKFKPIPLTLLDFMGILLPGVLWLLLLTITLQFIVNGDSVIVHSPLKALVQATTQRNPELSWTPIILSVLAASLLIGYILKPVAMRSAEFLALPFLKRQRRFRGIASRRLRYPFRYFYKTSECHREVFNFIKRELHCSPYRLPGSQPFSSAKRYIRLVAPPLWEESERMEAEIRMAGALLLGAAYSCLLSGGLLILHVTRFVPLPFDRNYVIWFVASIIATVILAESFNYLRLREVGYTYVNALIALRFRKESGHEKLEEDED